MWTREQAIERLQEMEKRPLMWALTREGYLLQVCTVLESMGSTDTVAHFMFNPNSEAEVDEAWAKRLMQTVWKYVEEKQL